MKRLGFLSIALAAILAVGCNKDNGRDGTNSTAANGSVGTAGDTDRSETKPADKDFVHDLVIVNMAEVELGKLAKEQTTNTEVRKFAQMMIDDHTKAGDKLKSVASAHNVPVPNALDEKHIELRDKLAKLKGGEFDREYMAAMVSGHQDVAAKLDSRVEKSDNVVTMSINEWAAEARPVVQAHLEAAKALQK
jgi:putative membrane protein